MSKLGQARLPSAVHREEKKYCVTVGVSAAPGLVTWRCGRGHFDYTRTFVAQLTRVLL